MLMCRRAMGLCLGALMLCGCANKAELEEAQSQRATLSTQLETIRNDRDQWQERYEKLQAQAKALQKDLDETKEKLGKAAEAFVKSEQDVAERKKEIDALNTKL